MRHFLLALILYLATPVMAADALVTNNGADSVTLLNAQCSTPAVLAQINPRIHQFMRQAAVVFEGKRFSPCWIVNGDSAHLMYEDGDQGMLPLADFRRAPDV